MYYKFPISPTEPRESYQTTMWISYLQYKYQIPNRRRSSLTHHLRRKSFPVFFCFNSPAGAVEQSQHIFRAFLLACSRRSDSGEKKMPRGQKAEKKRETFAPMLVRFKIKKGLSFCCLRGKGVSQVLTTNLVSDLLLLPHTCSTLISGFDRYALAEPLPIVVHSQKKKTKTLRQISFTVFVLYVCTTSLHLYNNLWLRHVQSCVDKESVDWLTGLGKAPNRSLQIKQILQHGMSSPPVLQKQAHHIAKNQITNSNLTRI